jgi:hypothetical protein
MLAFHGCWLLRLKAFTFGLLANPLVPPLFQSPNDIQPSFVSARRFCLKDIRRRVSADGRTEDDLLPGSAGAQSMQRLTGLRRWKRSDVGF